MSQEVLLAGEPHQHLAGRGTREQRGDDFKVEHLDAGAEAAADEWFDHANARRIHFQAARQHQVQVITDLGDALRGEAPANRIVIDKAGMRLDLRVIELGATDRFLAHQIGRCETCRNVAELVVHLAFDVAGLVGVQQHRVGTARSRRRVVSGQLPHFEFDQVQRARRDGVVSRRHSRDRLSAIAHPLTRQRMLVHGHGQYPVGVGTVCAGHHGDDPVERARLGNIETKDLAVAHWTSKNAADQGVGMFEICRVMRAPGDLLNAVDERQAAASGIIVPVRGHDAMSAAAFTDSIIFT